MVHERGADTIVGTGIGKSALVRLSAHELCSTIEGGVPSVSRGENAVPFGLWPTHHLKISPFEPDLHQFRSHEPVPYVVATHRRLRTFGREQPVYVSVRMVTKRRSSNGSS